MKKFIFLLFLNSVAFIIFIWVLVDSTKQSTVTNSAVQVDSNISFTVIDNCEYIKIRSSGYYFTLVHKGNCTNHFHEKLN